MPAKEECGTYAAYHRHRRRGEKPCDACTSAKTQYEQQKRAARRENLGSLNHGTATAWDSGCRCAECRAHKTARHILDHGITERQYAALLEAQGFGCAICGVQRGRDNTGGRLHIDHDHDCCDSSTGCSECVRGLLCQKCNIWGSRKTPDLWSAYLERPRPFAKRDTQTPENGTEGRNLWHMVDDILKFRAGDLKERVMEYAAENDLSVSAWLREASEAKLAADGCDDCGSCDICGGEVLALEYATDPETATIIATGSFDETANPEVQALIERAKELLAVGAVGVSVALDADPADMPNPNADQADIEDAMNAMESAHTRVRHVAIVDTPAFSGAFLDAATDGTLTGPVVFEGLPTGDGRGIPFENITLDESILPIPIIFDLAEGDHTGTVIGHIEKLERVAGIAGAGTAPVAASLDSYPAYLFSQPEPTAMTVHAPDAKGYRRYTGIIAPAGVCHKGMGGCYTYKGANLDYFHSGARVLLDDGSYTRVGPLMFGDLHADGTKMDYAAALTRTNEDARTVCAMGRVFDHPRGALFSGVLMPDADVPRIQACAPSVELWPDHRGKLELKTALLVPRPALPVAASLSGGGVQLAEAEQTTVKEPAGEHHTRLTELESRMKRLEDATAPMLAAHLAAQFDA